MKKLISASILVVALSAIPALALAGKPTTPSCWGQASAEFAQSAPGALGEHASSFDSPRLGIGNVANLFTGTHQPGLLGGVLGGGCD